MQSLARGLQVLEAFTGLPPSVTIPQLAKETGLARAVVTRCLHTLVALGYVEEHERHYSICPHVLRLAGAYLSARSLPILAQPLLEDLRDSLGESCSLGVLDGDEIVYVARASTTRIMAVSLHVGSRLPAYCTSMGRILLAALPPDKLQAALDRVTPIQRTPHSITDRAELQQAIMAVANQGYAVVDQELELGLRSVAVPVRDRNGRVVAALNLGTNAMRLSVKDLKARVLPELRAVAENLQRLAG
ncbi:MAG TPA: IclR family transcriptional regulator C-terminal domain-containing protein [Dongiaceae bacterium]|nr:IclR family transcriptional regulator C-terminal domain-containing protein [Dongiaceae bacterium]